MVRGTPSALRVGALALAAAVSLAVGQEARYLPGGPLAGLELPPNRVGRWGEVELYPGQVDYRKKTLRIDAPWPAACSGRVYEVGSPDRMTSYTAASVAPDGQGASITLDEGADYYRSPIRDVKPSGGILTCVLSFSLGKRKGLARNWVASNDQMTKLWRADQVAGNVFKLTGGPVSQADFAPSNALRLWEYGVGDTLRQSTFVSLRRVEDGVYELAGDTGVALSLKARELRLATDGRTWRPLDGTRAGEWLSTRIDLATLVDQPAHLRVAR